MIWLKRIFTDLNKNSPFNAILRHCRTQTEQLQLPHRYSTELTVQGYGFAKVTLPPLYIAFMSETMTKYVKFLWLSVWCSPENLEIEKWQFMKFFWKIVTKYHVYSDLNVVLNTVYSKTFRNFEEENVTLRTRNMTQLTHVSIHHRSSSKRLSSLDSSDYPPIVKY